MYSFLRGELVEITENACVLDINGIGYQIFITKKDVGFLLNKQGQETTLYVEQIVREDSLSLYGFSQRNNKDIFKILIQLSGIGPKLGLGILSDLTSDEFCKAVLTSDVLKLTSISGIGKKTAERMIIDLKDKLKNFSGDDLTTKTVNEKDIDPKIEEELMSALTALGYRHNEIKRMIMELKKENTTDLSLEDLIKIALRGSFK